MESGGRNDGDGGGEPGPGWTAGELDEPGCCLLADALGDSPETTIGVHLLRRGLCRAVVEGSPERPRAAVVQSRARPEEPIGFGDDPVALWSVLRRLGGWSAVNVALGVGQALAGRAEAATGRRSWLGEEIYHVLNRPVTPWAAPGVRRLTLPDLALVEASAEALGMHGWRFGSAEALLAEGFAAGAVVGGRLVAVAFASARTERHAEVGVVTLGPWRGRGLATTAAALVCAEVRGAGQRPVWSTAEENGASRRVAAKLGFVEVGRRVYVNLREEVPVQTRGAASKGPGPKTAS